MINQKKIPLIFNLFPRHFKTIHDWSDIIAHVKDMGFNSIYVNPFHETGFSGSLYAVKDYYRLNPLFLKPGDNPADFTPLKSFVEKCRESGLELIMDLVINHTAFDSVLTRSHSQWYKRDAKGNLMSPYAVDPADPSNVTIWGDLAEIDNEKSKDLQGLWNYWDELINYYQNMGILGYRCDAAYQVPASLWERLISSSKRRFPETTFYAETLGCQMSEIKALSKVGFDYLFNSSKWWNFDKPWAIEQHSLNKSIAPSVSFPESHDTERLASVEPGTIDVQKLRYAFAAVFSKGLLMPMGYEFGAITRMDVVNGSPEHVDKPKWDLSSWIRQINNLKTTVPVLSEEGQWTVLCEYHLPFLFLKKSSESGNPPVYICINKKLTKETDVEDWMIPDEVKSCTKALGLMSDTIAQEPMPQAFTLDSADIALFLK